MKQGLSLRVSQHLALTPQLQQSIRLLQLSTLELSQEVEQLLDENPFLERADDSVEREAYGLEHADTPVSPHEADHDHGSSATATDSSDEPPASVDLARDGDWDGDGAVDFTPDDSEWGGDAPARHSTRDDDEVDATELARSQESLQDHLKRQAHTLRLVPEDRAALLFLIESLNDDGYLEDSLEALAEALAGGDLDQREAVLEHFRLALRLLQSLEPAGVGARNLPECLHLQLQIRQAELKRGVDATESELLALALALRLVKQPPELLARRDLRRLAQLGGGSEALTREALALIARLEPKPGRRFVDVERHIIAPDVLVLRTGSGAQTRFRVQLNPDVMPRLRVHDIYANALKGHK
ncbi:MAG: RNA polymerase factor sigma-54, partial [Curvibacter sp.]